MKCDRCGVETDRLYTWVFKDDDGRLVKMRLCWDCDFEVANGDDPFMDEFDVWLTRRQQNYEYDPINNTPFWLKEVEE